ncbi:hypothetical protein PIB30_071545, partial [Stylosanthes scabra]|nr:hypothetical protein [Stylosanthes scabra]
LCPARLTQATERLQKSARLIRLEELKTRRKSHEHFFCEVAMEEGLVNIQLLDGPIADRCQG